MPFVPAEAGTQLLPTNCANDWLPFFSRILDYRFRGNEQRFCRPRHDRPKPGGNCIPPVSADIFSCIAVSALRRASFSAATIRSSRTSRLVRLHQRGVDLQRFDFHLRRHGRRSPARRRRCRSPRPAQVHPAAPSSSTAAASPVSSCRESQPSQITNHKSSSSSSGSGRRQVGIRLRTRHAADSFRSSRRARSRTPPAHEGRPARPSPVHSSAPAPARATSAGPRRSTRRSPSGGRSTARACARALARANAAPAAPARSRAAHLRCAPGARRSRARP